MTTQKIEEDIHYVEVSLEAIKARLTKFKLDIQRNVFWPGDDEKELSAIYGEIQSLGKNLKL
jgi:hypothetical protein